MKKVFAFLAVAAFAVAFTACGGKKAEEVVTETPEVAVDTTATVAADTTAADTTVVAQ